MAYAKKKLIGRDFDLIAHLRLVSHQDGKIAEHWDILESIPARADWKNENGKF